MRVLRVGLLAVVLVILGGCGAGAGTSGSDGMPPGGSGAVVSSVAADRRVALVYAAVIRHHLTVAAASVPRVVYVLDRAVPDAADTARRVDDEGGVAIDDRVQEQVAAELAGLDAIRFVASARAVLTADQDCPAITEQAMVLVLAPVPASGDRVKLGLAEHSNACLSGQWQTYVLVRTDAGWSVEGTTGPLVIS